MRTIASKDGFEIKQDINGSISLNGRQFESAMDAARSVRDNPELCAALIKQVLDANSAHVDGPLAYEEWRKAKAVIVEDGLKELTGAPLFVEGDSDEGR